MALFSGKDGSVSGPIGSANVTKWTCDLTVSTSRVGHSNSSGWKATVAGTKEGTGSYEAKLDSGDTIPNIGDSVSLTLNTGGSLQLSGNAIIKSVHVEVDIDNGEAVGYSASFETDGPWTVGRGT